MHYCETLPEDSVRREPEQKAVPQKLLDSFHSLQNMIKKKEKTK